MNLPLDNLYEIDFYAWTQKQVQLLRQRDLNNLDIENLIEEIASLGKQERRELVNRLIVLIAHLLKWEYQTDRRSRSWYLTIREQSRAIRRLLKESPSLKPYLPEAIADAYEDAVILAAKETGMKLRDFPTEVSYTWEQVENPDFLPGILLDSDADLLN
ncbi:DUF29 domain-containing protein [Floridanema evergladense]|uniref:DUF29 domain-containing protein n=1 Tax=Floridaenema evergladense BLCC-F167 TaxID=3153639 RepID=A0ABV4WWE8_9CYAN